MGAKTSMEELNIKICGMSFHHDNQEKFRLLSRPHSFIFHSISTNSRYRSAKSQNQSPANTIRLNERDDHTRLGQPARWPRHARHSMELPIHHLLLQLVRALPERARSRRGRRPPTSSEMQVSSLSDRIPGAAAFFRIRAEHRRAQLCGAI